MIILENEAKYQQRFGERDKKASADFCATVVRKKIVNGKKKKVHHDISGNSLRDVIRTSSLVVGGDINGALVVLRNVKIKTAYIFYEVVDIEMVGYKVVGVVQKSEEKYGFTSESLLVYDDKLVFPSNNTKRTQI